MNKINFLVAGSLFFSILLAGCGGGNGGSTPPAAVLTTIVTPPPAFKYAALNGSYSCSNYNYSTTLNLTAIFTSTSVVFTTTGIVAGLKFEYKDKVGMVLGMPYYSNNIPLTANAESAFFFNGNLVLVTTPAVDVPDLFAQRPTSTLNCTKTA